MLRESTTQSKQNALSTLERINKMKVFVLLEEGEFVAIYRSRKDAEKSALENDMHNFHIIETTIRD